MRSRKILLTLGLIGVIGIGLAFSGCSNDDRLTPVEPTINDQYSFVQSEVDGVVDQAVSLMGTTLEMFESNSQVVDTAVIADLRESPFDPDSVFSSDDWYILFSNQMSSAYGSFLMDSILFTNNGANVEYASDANGLVIRHLYQKANVDTDVTYTDYNVNSDLIFSGLNTVEATISGDWSVTTIDQIVDGTTEIRTYSVEAVVNNLVVAKPDAGWGGGCPASGTIDFTVGLSFQDGDATAVNSSWEFTVTFTDGTAAVSVTDGEASASYTRDCCTP